MIPKSQSKNVHLKVVLASWFPAWPLKYSTDPTWRPQDLGELEHWQVGWSPPRSPWSGSSGWSRRGRAAPRGPRRRRRSAWRRGRRQGRRWRRRWRWGRREGGERGGEAGGAGTQTCLLQSRWYIFESLTPVWVFAWQSCEGNCWESRPKMMAAAVWPLAPTWPPRMEFYLEFSKNQQQIYSVVNEENILSLIMSRTGLYIKISYLIRMSLLTSRCKGKIGISRKDITRLNFRKLVKCYKASLTTGQCQ